MPKDWMIRLISEEDASRLLEIYSYYILNTAITYEIEIPSLEEFKERIRNISSKYPYFYIETKGIIAGYAYASAFHPRKAYEHTAELSIYLDPAFQKKGYGKILYDELEKSLKKMNVLVVYACIAYPQKEDEFLGFNSILFHEHLGFKKCGDFKNCAYKFNRWYHMCFLEKRLELPVVPIEDFIPYNSKKYNNKW